MLKKETDQLPHPYAIGDELHLRQIFINLLGNAVKFTPDGGTVLLRACETKANEKKMIICFEISDNGPGMSSSFLETIFEPYSQEKSPSAEEGTGLGMTITKHFVDLMGGTIEVKSELAKGSHFFITIPFEIASAPEHGADKERNLNLNHMNLLLVEDNELNLEIARDMLVEAEMNVTIARNGAEAVDIFLHSEPGELDLILMDIIMPVMDGLEAAGRIRSSSHPSAKSIPILAMTANAYAEDVEKSKAAGMNEHLSKPFGMEELMQKLSSFRKT
jgi:CheY-like chemotaxis protein